MSEKNQARRVVLAAGLCGCFLAMLAADTTAVLPSLRDSAPSRASKRSWDRDPGTNTPVVCQLDQDCNDDNPCTIDLCNDGVCTIVPIPKCRLECRADWDCGDENPCTYDLCNDGSCEHVLIEGCQWPCQTDEDCDDDNACTQDVCVEGYCIHNDIPDCIPCDPDLICPPLDLVVVMDTSGSMKDESDALCDTIDQLVDDLAAAGVLVTPYLLGITEMPGLAFWCLDGRVIDLPAYDGTVPGDPGDCPFPDGSAPEESWGPATAIVAGVFGWTEGSVRVVVPISDEAPCNGSIPSGCNDPGDDRDSITNAINVANENDVIVSPILGNGAGQCVTGLAADLATGTGGTAFESVSPHEDLADGLYAILLAACETVPQCDDGNACTDDYCDEEGVCRFEPNFDESVYCCNPQDGTLTPIDDDNVCTEDLCDPDTGEVSHLPTEGAPCDDGDPCTVMDECDDEGNCAGTDITTIPCDSNDDCFGYDCDTETGYCVCEKTHTLCLVAVPSPEANEDCYRVGEELIVNVELGFGSAVIVAGQFVIPYDPNQLQFVSMTPGSEYDPDSPFSFEVFREVNEEDGLIVYSTSIEFAGVGTQGPAIMATLRFLPILPCSETELCFTSENPRNTLLIDDLAQEVPFELDCCTVPLWFDDGEPTLECPQSVEVNPSPGHLHATVTWDPITVIDGCDTELTLDCTAVHSHGVDIDDLIEGGGVFPTGLAEFECVGTDSCGYEVACSWHVYVSTMNTLRVEVHLSPTMVEGPLLRCIIFEFFSSCMEEPEVTERTLRFGLPYDLPGHAKGIEFNIPAGQYACMTARDPLHTLRSTADIDIQADEYIAIFKGDPFFGGNWLVGGNLDQNREIDVLDFAEFFSQEFSVLDPDTPCGTQGPHADINGDGIVDPLDWSFIQTNLLSTDEDSCCPEAGASARSMPITDISVKDLVRMGLEHLSIADLNEDGRVNSEDIAAYMNGERASRSDSFRYDTSPDGMTR